MLGKRVSAPVGDEQQDEQAHQSADQPAQRASTHPAMQACRCRTADSGLMAVTARRALLGERIARHGLATRPADSALTATRLTTAIQAQDNLAARLGVRARSSGPVDADVRHAIEHDRTIVRTWLMRGTIHLVDAHDLRWLVRLIGPVVARKFRTRWRQLGLTDEVLERCVELLPTLLADGPRNRHEIRAGLAAEGVILDSPDPQVHTHTLVYASTLGLICRGPDRGRHSTFVLLDDWLPDAPAGPSGDDAVAELARRYFAAYSPATALDFATWSALPHGRVYQGGMIRPTVLVDGAVVGTWALDRARGRVTVSPFKPLSTRARRAVDAEIADIGRFLDRELTATFS
jgi:hypothetical protein